MERTVHCAYPKHLGDKVVGQFVGDLAKAIRGATGIEVATSLIAYGNVRDAADGLRSVADSGVVVFVLSDDPAAYHQAAFLLDGWRVKRVTQRALCRHFGFLTTGAWNGRRGRMDQAQGLARWTNFVALNAFDVLQRLDVIPYRVSQAGPYEAQLVIDVGRQWRHFALSLQIARSRDKPPDFGLATDVVSKADHQHEAVNGTILRDRIVDLVDRSVRRPCAPLDSVLVVRDGRLWSDESRGIDEAFRALRASGKVAEGARIDLVELRKDSLAFLRIWNVTEDGGVENPLEGTAVRINVTTMLLATTGQATLHQGMADPLLIVGNGRCASVSEAASAVFAGAQLNWSSPTVAQRLPITLKRTDEELTARADQEVQRIR